MGGGGAINLKWRPENKWCSQVSEDMSPTLVDAGAAHFLAELSVIR